MGVPVLEPVVVLYKWNTPGYREPFYAEYVNELVRLIRLHHAEPIRIVCVTDDPEGVECETFPLWDDYKDMGNPSGRHLPSCYRRLKLFAEETTAAMGIALGQKVVSMDVDMVPVRDLVPVFAPNDHDFMGWRVPGANHHVVFNGSMYMFKAGAVPHLWEEFDPERSPQEARSAGFFGSDQGWISYCMQGHDAGWGRAQGVYGYRELRPYHVLPQGARIVSFCGKHKPWHVSVRRESPWIAEHWRIRDA